MVVYRGSTGKSKEKTEILHQQAVNSPSIVTEQRFGDRDVLFEYDCEYDYEYRLSPEYEYGGVDFRRVRGLKTDSNTHHDRLREKEPLTAFWERRRQTWPRQSRTKAWHTLSCAPGDTRRNDALSAFPPPESACLAPLRNHRHVATRPVPVAARIAEGCVGRHTAAWPGWKA